MSGIRTPSLPFLFRFEFGFSAPLTSYCLIFITGPLAFCLLTVSYPKCSAPDSQFVILSMSSLVTELLPVIVIANTCSILSCNLGTRYLADIDLLRSNVSPRVDAIDHHLFAHLERSVGLKLSSASEPSCLVPHLFLKTLCLSGQKAQAGWKAKSQFTFSCSICPFPWM